MNFQSKRDRPLLSTFSPCQIDRSITDPNKQNMNHNPEQSAISQIHLEEKNHFNVLPDEILLQIFNKLSDLKTLCFCSLASHRFASIIPHVDHVYLTVPRQNPNSTHLDNRNPTDNFPKKLFGFLINGVVAKPFKFVRQLVSPKPIPRSISSFYGDSFRSAVSFLSKFKEIKILDLELPSSCDELSSDYFDGNFLFKWGAIFGSKIDTFMFLSLCSIHQKEQVPSWENDSPGLGRGVIHLAFQCLKEAIVRQRMLLFFIEQHPLLERVCITDSKKQGMLSLRDEKLHEVRNWIGFNLDTIGSELKSIEVPVSARQWCVPVLKLPVSGYMVQGATLILMGMGSGGGGSSGGGGDSFDNGIEILEGLEVGEDAFGEAVKEIMLNHRSEMKILL